MRRLLEIILVCTWKFIDWYDHLPCVQKKLKNEYDEMMYEFVMSRLS